MLTCQRCHAQTDDGAVFCDACGHELQPATPRDGRTHPPHPGYTALAATFTSGAPASPIGAMRVEASSRVAAPATAQVIIALHLPNGRRFSLRGKSDYTVGRASADLGIPDVDLSAWQGSEAGVSRRHLMIHAREDGVFVEDLESRNETVQNGYRLLPQQWYPLHDGDELRLGAIILYVSFERP